MVDLTDEQLAEWLLRALRDARAEAAGWRDQDERNLAEIVALGDRIEAAGAIIRRRVTDDKLHDRLLAALTAPTGQEP